MEAAGFRQRLAAAVKRSAPPRRSDDARARPPYPAIPGITLVEALVPAHARFLVAFVARKWGVSELEAAVALGRTTPAAVARALAARIGGIATSLDGATPTIAADPADWLAIVQRGEVGIDRAVGGKARLIAPGPEEAERIAANPRGVAAGLLPVLVTTPEAFARLIREWAAGHWIDEANHALLREDPDRSASDGALMARMATGVTLALAILLVCLTTGPAWLAAMAGGIIGAAVLVWTVFRLVASGMAVEALPRRSLEDRDLPRYTLLCPLYREERVAASLLAALGRIDYPAARLDIKLILEADDGETLAAVRARPLPPTVEILVLPPGGPRTKPRALMMALPFARGELVAVYDAEDRPGRAQLREAAETFAAAGARLGCLQAPLSIANPDDTWLTRFFAAEYDALFRVLLPAFARLRLPMPLGGTSNHFRINALRQSLGWDPYNVTEDADLGFRLACNGWRIGAIATPTVEEAPPTFSGWLRQRSRWFKGWLQTLAVLARRPRRLWRELGAGGVLALVATLAGSLGSALVHIVCWVGLAVTIARGVWPDWIGPAAAVFLAGYLGSILHMLVGRRRAGRKGFAPWLALLPLAWLAMGIAALRAVWELRRRPHHWDKTEHGLSAAWAAGAAEADLPGVAQQEIAERVLAIIASSDRLMADGRHAPADVAGTLRRLRTTLADLRPDPQTLDLYDAYCASVDRRAANPAAGA
ncbi:MAG: glycosyltransferase [Phreatobacter sp.]|uniref:glycosyltransferase family 2 protein n=1 Tax=Phreatobacter sp. TaxID=1966341 RepID=UPI001A620996|nr:glycosyltransferase family 2 protein [Phreatobacter sp.]MBL8570380.1 glycosyltransferase [Phreatobacter sp.]